MAAWPSGSPAQCEKIEPGRHVLEADLGARGKRQERVSDPVAADDAALRHHCLARPQPALPVLETDQGKNEFVGRGRTCAIAGQVMTHDGSDQLACKCAGHRTGCARVEVVRE